LGHFVEPRHALAQPSQAMPWLSPAKACLGSAHSQGMPWLSPAKACLGSAQIQNTICFFNHAIAAGIDEATPQGPKRLPAAGGQSDFRSYCPAPAGPFSDRGVARKARLPPTINNFKNCIQKRP